MMTKLLSLSCLLFALCVSSSFGEVVVKSAFRTIDLTSQLSTSTVQVEYVNKGNAAIDEIKYSTPSAVGKLAWLEASLTDGDSLEVTESDGFVISLAEPLQSGSSVEITVVYVYTHTMVPLPAEITQNENQLVVYKDNHYISFPYKSNSQKTVVQLQSTIVKSFSEEKPSSHKGDTVDFGPYKNVAAHSSSPMTIHFQNNAGFVVITDLVREIEVSHWGNVAVEETYKMEHQGAKLKGAFSRYDYQRTPAPSAVAEIKSVLPNGASGVYYRDEIGNISTSNFNVADEGVVTFDYKPRYVLFGGWSTEFYMGYNLPSFMYLSTNYDDSTQYVLNVPFAKSQDDCVIDSMTVRVILPEGSTDIEVVTSFPVSETEHSKHFTYLDTSGRPVVSVTLENVVDQHNQDFQVVYRFKKFSMICEPFLLVSAFFCIFLSIMVFVRIDMSIKKVEGKSVEMEAQSLGCLAAYRTISEKRNIFHDELTKIIDSFRKSKSLQKWNNDYKKVSNNFDKLEQEALKVINGLASADPTLAHRVRDVERKEKERRQVHDAIATVEANYIQKKSLKKDFAEQKQLLQSQFDNLDYEVDDAVTQVTEDL